MVWYCIVSYCITCCFYFIVSKCVTLYDIVFNCIILYSIILYSVAVRETGPPRLIGRPTKLSGRNRFGSVRFDSRLFDNSSVRFGSILKSVYPGSTRFGLRCCGCAVARSGSVRFGSIPPSVPIGSRIKRFGSIRFGRFGSVRFGLSFLPELWVWVFRAEGGKRHGSKPLSPTLSVEQRLAYYTIGS